MTDFVGAYVTVTTKGDYTTEFLLCVGRHEQECKREFIKWYDTVNYYALSVRYSPVVISEEGKG